MWLVSIGTVAGTLLFLYTPLHGSLKLAPLTIGQYFTAFGIGAASVLWYEFIKLWKRHELKKMRKGGRQTFYWNKT